MELFPFPPFSAHTHTRANSDVERDEEYDVIRAVGDTGTVSSQPTTIEHLLEPNFSDGDPDESPLEATEAERRMTDAGVF